MDVLERCVGAQNELFSRGGREHGCVVADAARAVAPARDHRSNQIELPSGAERRLAHGGIPSARRRIRTRPSRVPIQAASRANAMSVAAAGSASPTGKSADRPLARWMA